MDSENRAAGAGVKGYVDVYLLPVPEANLEPYRQQATTFGAVDKEHGALSYREFRGDDVGESLRVPDGRVLTVAVAEFDSRSHRDEVMAKVMEDPRVTKMLEGALAVDVGDGEAEEIALPESVLWTVIGGVGLGTWLLHRLAPPGVDSLAPEVPLVFAFSPLVGTPLTTSAKFAGLVKSPLIGMPRASPRVAVGAWALVGRAPLRRALRARLGQPARQVVGVEVGRVDR
jgi:uncharacterized protein YbaA (DUF1428 family)